MSRLNIEFTVINPLKHNISSVQVNHQPNTVGRVRHIERGVMAVNYGEKPPISRGRH